MFINGIEKMKLKLLDMIKQLKIWKNETPKYHVLTRMKYNRAMKDCRLLNEMMGNLEIESYDSESDRLNELIEIAKYNYFNDNQSIKGLFNKYSRG